MEPTHLGHLTPDPKNARAHNPRNVGLIEDALREVGFARSIVIDENGVILAGNATVEAAAAAGIERVKVVEADGETVIAVRRTGLSAEQKTRLALYDNRAAELAEWDATALAALAATGGDALDGLFYPDELAAILAESRAAIHTYPTEGVAMVDVFPCGSLDPAPAITSPRAALHGTSGARSLQRGVGSES